MKICKVAGCTKDGAKGRGMCSTHYNRWLRHGDTGLDAPVKKVNSTRPGLVREYLNNVVVPYDGEECLTWPYSTKRGYAKAQIDGRTQFVSRYLCEVQYGPAPSEDHQAAHSCGRGAAGCVTNKHLRWATVKENAADKNVHGRQVETGKTPRVKLTPSTAVEVRRMDGKYREIAAHFGLSESHVYLVKSGRIWAWVDG